MGVNASALCRHLRKIERNVTHVTSCPGVAPYRGESVLQAEGVVDGNLAKPTPHENR